MRSGTPRENTERVSAAPTSPVRPAGAAPARPARQAGKATGAWADGDRTPLNHNEEFKQADDGLNVRQRIIEDYSRNGFAAIPGDDLRGRMRWWGLYTQRRPGIDGGKTAKAG